jgi:hypothetical protein
MNYYPYLLTGKNPGEVIMLNALLIGHGNALTTAAKSRCLSSARELSEIRGIPASEMSLRAALVRTDIREEPIDSIIRVTRIGELGTTLGVTINYSCYPDDEGGTFLRHVGSYKSYMG